MIPVLPFVSVIIPVLDDPVRLALCLQALEDQTYAADRYEVIVVDNGSVSDLAPVVVAFAHAQLAVEPRRGSYAARNMGIGLARGEVLAFTDSDCIPQPDWLEAGVARLMGAAGCGLVGGRVAIFARDERRPSAAEL